MNSKYKIYLAIGIVLLAVIVMFAIYIGKQEASPQTGEILEAETESITEKITEKVYVAMGGGKEGFIKDEEVKAIMAEKYNIELIADSWSNNRLIADKVKLVREDGTPYDAVFFSDQRFYDYFKVHNLAKNLEGSIALNTPVVIYSWDQVAEALINEGIVEVREGTYFIKDMKGLLTMIQEGRKWSDIGLTNVFGAINIASTDPVTSSPGATYYGLLLSILNEGTVTENTVHLALPALKEFYEFSGFMNNTPADLFDLYLRTGMGAKPLIVDYEKSMLEFAVNNPEGYKQVRDRVRILYPEPTIWNSHCLLTLTEQGNRYLQALNDPAIKKIAWEQYGFRTGFMGGDSLGELPVDGVAAELTSIVPGLKKEIYDMMIDTLKE
ncbi:MAG: hypothetical protein AAGU12_09800 [Clostridiales bacterium]